MRYHRWPRWLACTLLVPACSPESARPIAVHDSVPAPIVTAPTPATATARKSPVLRPAAATSESTFDTTIVQDVRGERRFDYVVRRQGPRFTLIARGDSTENHIAELDLLRPGDTVPLQRIETMPEAPPRGERDIKFEDVNHDGYTDLLVLGAWGTGGLYWWSWHFEPASSRLVADSSAADPVM